MKFRTTILKYHLWYLCQISLQIMLLPILVNWITPLYGCCGSYRLLTIGSLSGNVFERRVLTGSEPFSVLISLDVTKLVLLSAFTLQETICPNICSKSRPKSAKNPLPVDVRRSKTPLLWCGYCSVSFQSFVSRDLVIVAIRDAKKLPTL